MGTSLYLGKDSLSLPILQCQKKRGKSPDICSACYSCLYHEYSFTGIRFIICGDLQIPHMDPGDPSQLHRTENTGKTPEILILQPGRTAPFINLHGKAVSLFLNNIRNAKFGGRKRILGITHIFSIQPYGKSCFHAMK